MTSQQLTKESILQAIETSKATSISGIHKALGGKGNISGSTAKRIRELVPDIQERLKANQEVKPGKNPVKKFVASKGKKGYPRSLANPFRENSGYSRVFDILCAHPHGLPRQELVQKYAKVSGKNLKLAGFDVSVLMSASESPTGPRHKSCREGFWIRKENDHVTLVTK